MQPLGADAVRRLRGVHHDLAAGAPLSQETLEALRADWSSEVCPDGKDESEDFEVVEADGSPTGAVGPRWLFHLLGLCHRASHVGLATPGGLVVLQRRAPTKADWPDAWDMAVAGHVPAGLSYEEGALKEIEEEVGLLAGDLPGLLAEGGLAPVGPPYYCFDLDEGRNPPFYNAEARQLFAATLTPEGLARLAPDPEELSGIYLCPPEEAWDLLARAPLASGARYSLPRFLDWLMARG